MRCSFAFFCAILLLSTARVEAATVVMEPPPDMIVTTPEITISGTSNAAVVTLHNGNAPSTAVVVEHVWTFIGVPLAAGFNTLTIRDGSPDDPVTLFITRAETLPPRPEQKVRFVWTDGTDDVLAAIARGTLTPTPDQDAVDLFVREVKQLTADVFTRTFAPIADIRLVPDEADDVHTVRFLASEGSAFGGTIPDCGNQDLHGRSRIWVSFFRDLMVGHLDAWPPMKSDDALDIRIRDLSEALGRTAAHEVGHGVGLVIGDPGSPCAWMNGCHDSHGCDTFQLLHPGIRRYAKGTFIMDPGDETPNRLRLAETGEEGRGAQREPAIFCDFDRHYLRTIHPLPEGGHP